MKLEDGYDQFGNDVTQNVLKASAGNTPVPRGAIQIIDLGSDYATSDDEDIRMDGFAGHVTTDDASQPSMASQVLHKQTSTPTTKHYLPVARIRFGIGPLLWYDSVDEKSRFSQIFKQKFDKDFLSRPDQRNLYQSIMEDPDHYLGDFQCLDLRIDNATRGVSCTYVKSDHKLEYVCDRCITRRRLCIKPSDIGHARELVVYPLPDRLRVGQEWQDRLYWIRS